MVAEADESDRSFLKLFPTIAVMTNIDHEHLENYGGFDDLQQAFVDFANKVPFYGARGRVRSTIRTGARRCCRAMTRRVMTYGLERRRRDDRPATRRGARGRSASRRQCTARPTPATRRTTVTLGDAALAGAGAPQPAERAGRGGGRPRARPAVRAHRRRRSQEFRGAERRFDVRGEPNGILVVDDYGHHPTEIAAVLAAARARSAAGSSSRSSRTAITRTRGAAGRVRPGARRGADHVVLTDIYARGRGADRRRDARGAGRGDSPQRHGAGRRRAARSTMWSPAIVRVARPGDVVITLGAGSIGDDARPDLIDGARGRAGAATERRAPHERGRARSRSRASAARTSSRRAGGAAGARWRWPLPVAGRCVAASSCYAGYRGADVAAHARVLQVERIIVHGNERLSSGEVLAVLNGLRGESLMLDRPRRVAAAAAGVAVGARRGAAAVAAVDGRSRGLRAAADRHRPASSGDAVSGRRARRRHRPVRAAVRGARPADHRRPGRARRRAASR